MNLERIAIVGTSCSGKSTLARELSRRLGAPHVELDELFWGPEWTARSAEEFAASVERATAWPAWIVDGNYSAVRSLVLQRATAVIWLNYPLSTLMRRAVSRTVRRLVTRERIFNGNREPLLGFLNSYWIPWWVLRTCGERQREYAELLASPECGHLRVIEIRSSQQLANLLAEFEDRVERTYRGGETKLRGRFCGASCGCAAPVAAWGRQPGLSCLGGAAPGLKNRELFFVIRHSRRRAAYPFRLGVPKRCVFGGSITLSNVCVNIAAAKNATALSVSVPTLTRS